MRKGPRGHSNANLLRNVPILLFVLPKRGHGLSDANQKTDKIFNTLLQLRKSSGVSQTLMDHEQGKCKQSVKKEMKAKPRKE